MKTATTPSGIIVPTQQTPAGYIRLTNLDGAPLIISVAFMVSVEQAEHGARIDTTLSEGCYNVREAFDTVLRSMCEVHG